MDKMKTVIAAAIVAVGIVVLGFCIKAGLGSFLQNQRVVTVKGLAVREVKANKVIWPIVFKELGDDLPRHRGFRNKHKRCGHRPSSRLL